MQGLTLRSWVWGLLLALVMCSANTVLTLKVGIIEEGAVVTLLLFMIAMMIGRALFKADKVTKSEAVMVATMGSAGGSLAFIANFFAALHLAGEPMSLMQMMIFPIVTSAVGLVLAIPMRQLFVVTEPLPWPTAKVVVSAIDSVVDVEDSMQPRILGLFAILATVYVIWSEGGMMGFPTISSIGLLGLGQFGFGIAWSPFILGAGYLIGLRVGWGFMVGALVLVGMAPFLPAEIQGSPHKFIWPGVMALVTCGVTDLLLNGRTIIRALKSLSPRNMRELESQDQIMSSKKLFALVGITILTAAIVLHIFFDIPWYMGIVGFLLGAIVFNMIATRAAGETAFNPVRVMGVMLQGAFAFMGGTSVATNLTGAGVASGAIGQTGVLTQDTAFGRHFKVPAKWQVLSQAAVLLPISMIVAVVYWLVTNAWEMGSSDLPAPIAIMWESMAKVFSGEQEFTQLEIYAMWIGGIAGVILALIDKVAKTFIGKATKNEEKSLWRFWPHSLGITLGMILPIPYDVAFFVGAIFLCYILPKTLKTDDDTLNTLAAAGIIGSGIGSLIVAILVVTGLIGGH